MALSMQSMPSLQRHIPSQAILAQLQQTSPPYPSMPAVSQLPPLSEAVLSTQGHLAVLTVPSRQPISPTSPTHSASLQGTPSVMLSSPSMQQLPQTQQPKWHQHEQHAHAPATAPVEPDNMSHLPQFCETEFRRADALFWRGVLDSSQCRQAFSQVLLMLWPAGAPMPPQADLLDYIFSELDNDLDGMLNSAEFFEFVRRGVKPIVRAQKLRQRQGLPWPEKPRRSGGSVVPVQQEESDGIMPAPILASVARDVAFMVQEYTIPEGRDQSTLGKGAFGTVLKVTHNASGDQRACKAVPVGDGQSAASAQLRELVELEVSMLKSLDHVNLLRLHEAFRNGSQCVYLITELCAGGSLAERLESQKSQRRSLLEGQVAAYVEQILSAANYCHARDVLHRDLKTENILFMTDRFDSPLKVIDFGLSDTMERIRHNVTHEVQDREGALGAVARMLPQLPGGLEILATKVSKEVMQRAGTPHYMAPEVYEGRYDTAADVWSIGVILFEMVSNRHPFYSPGNDLEAVRNRILNPGGADFSDPAWSKVSSTAQRFCRAALTKDPRKRATAKELLADRWLESVPRLALGLPAGLGSPGTLSQAPGGQAVPLTESFFGSAAAARMPGAQAVLDALRAFAGPKGRLPRDDRAESLGRVRRGFLRALARELSEAQILGLRGAFLRLDRNGDGTLTAADFTNSFASTRRAQLLSNDENSSHLHASFAGDIELRTLLATANSHGTSQLSFSEFLAVMLPGYIVVRPHQLFDAFRRLDTHGLDRLPLGSVLAMLEVGPAEAEQLSACLPQDFSFRDYQELLAVQIGG
eukprot:TRINITY_DN22768_c0_g1_i1.p1 TRINITY_DN22768_c0_g1~~TRINITY_DN22768_c0_g1_i1.p1  ORF type:complete len:812 (+),score=145.84 TRINITY_DN22768_c0_g1_i1:35-2470(+)